MRKLTGLKLSEKKVLLEKAKPLRIEMNKLKFKYKSNQKIFCLRAAADFHLIENWFHPLCALYYLSSFALIVECCRIKMFV